MYELTNLKVRADHNLETAPPKSAEFKVLQGVDVTASVVEITERRKTWNYKISNLFNCVYLLPFFFSKNTVKWIIGHHIDVQNLLLWPG